MVSLVEGDDAQSFQNDMSEYMEKFYPNRDVRLLDVDNEGGRILEYPRLLGQRTD